MRPSVAAALTIALALCAPPRAARPETASPRPSQASIVGTWIHVKGPTDYDSIEFALDGSERVFRSWMHDRPASFGHWTLQGKTLTVEIDDQDKLVWSVVSVAATKLVLHQDGERAETTYRRATSR
jgi:hypothetical protein